MIKQKSLQTRLLGSKVGKDGAPFDITEEELISDLLLS